MVVRLTVWADTSVSWSLFVNNVNSIIYLYLYLYYYKVPVLTLRHTQMFLPSL
jgi:hypothetical protein